MKVLSGISVLALLMAGVATPSFATSLAPGGTATPLTNVSNPFTGSTILANTGLVTYDVGVGQNDEDAGTVQEWALSGWSGNPGGITFVYQVSITNSTGIADQLTGGNYAGFTTDVFQSSVSGNTAASDATRSANGSVVGFDFPPPSITDGDTSYYLIVATNANSYTTGSISVIDDHVFGTDGFAPANTPEPSTLSLLGTGLLAAGAGLRRKMLRK